MPRPAITAVVVSNEHAPHDPPTQTSGTAQHRADSHNAVSNECKAAIVGVRYRCSMCPNYDLCDTCMAKTPIAHPAEHLFLRINHPRVPAGVFGKSGVRFSSYPALQNRSKIKHVGVHCFSCGTQSIVGIRYQCMECSSVNLCEACEMKGVHNVLHTRRKIAKPEECHPRQPKKATENHNLPNWLPEPRVKLPLGTPTEGSALPLKPLAHLPESLHTRRKIAKPEECHSRQPKKATKKHNLPNWLPEPRVKLPLGIPTEGSAFL